jgi:hypothetical protein
MLSRNGYGTRAFKAGAMLSTRNVSVEKEA